MHVFVDFLGARGTYRAATDPSWIDPGLPTSVLIGSAFLEAAGEPARQRICALYHVERNRFLSASRLGQADVMEFDTIVVVNSDDSLFREHHAVEALWWSAGCPQRRLVHAGIPTVATVSVPLYAN